MDSWVDLLCDLIPIAPVYDLARSLDYPFAIDNEMVREVPHPERSDMRLLGNPLKLDGERLPAQPCHALGQDTDTLLRELGYGEAQIADLHGGGIV